MLVSAPSCPECSCRDTRWLPSTSDGAFVDYFRCEACRTVWVVNSLAPNQSRQVTPPMLYRPRSAAMFLFVTIEAGLLFATLASNHNDELRRRLHQKAQTALDAVIRFLPRAEMTAHERHRATHGLALLSEAIRGIDSE